jgi:prepilin-type N-terminal cleavage/methylation domain-containing protein
MIFWGLPRGKSAAGVSVPPKRKLYGFGAGVRVATERGVTLFELLVAVLLLALVSVMIYSVLRVSIDFSEKGSKQILAMEREQSLLALISKQVRSAWYDPTKRQAVISVKDGVLKIVTKNPLMNKEVGLALAIYRFNSQDQTLYYTEKVDYYNIDYDDDYVPEFVDMIPLLTTGLALDMEYDEEAAKVLLVYGEREYEFTPRCSWK